MSRRHSFLWESVRTLRRPPSFEKKTELATNRKEGIVDFHDCCERSCF